MSQVQLSKLWSVISTFCLYYAMNSAVVERGGTSLFDVGLIASGSGPIAMTAIPIIALTSLLSSLVGWQHASRSDALSWADRFPLMGFSSIETRDAAARWFQGVIWALFSILPLVSLAHFWSRFLAAKFARQDASWTPIDSVWNFGEATSNDPARICSSYLDPALGKTGQCLGNATVIPGWHPWVFVLFTALACLTALAFWWRVLVRKPPTSQD